MKENNERDTALDSFITEHVKDVQAKMNLIIEYLEICKAEFELNPNCASIHDIALIKKKLNEIIEFIDE
ncbi:MAG: hypothetical protein HXX09_11470 [Bacteroidetes bacterium]|nr:hypothetical protein [Bacteroidota bacterium]